MSRTLTLLFRRDPTRDRQKENIRFEGYQPLWPDGGRVDIGLDAFCKHGIRLLGLGKHLEGCHEKLINVISVPLSGRDDDLTRIPGHRVRRFFVERTGSQGRLHFMDGTPTTIVFDANHDDPRVVHWIGLNGLSEGERLWFDLAATAPETQVPVWANRMVACEV